MQDPNGMISEMEFERQLEDMGDNQLELIKFIARRQYRMTTVCVNHGRKIYKLEIRNKRILAITGGSGTFLGGLAITVFNYFSNR